MRDIVFKRVSSAVALLLAVALLAVPSVGFGAGKVAPAEYAVQLVAEMEQGNLGAIAVATIPDDVKLPATVRVMVPKGFHPTWVGQIMGDDTSGDEEVAYTEGTSDKGAYLEVVATKSHVIQAEGLVHDGLTYDGAKTVISTSITNPTDTPNALELTLVVPAAGGAPSGEPAVTAGPNVDSSGQKLYNLEPTTISGDQTIAISESYETNGATQSAAAGSQNAALPIAIVAIVLVIIVAGIVFLVRKKRAEDVYYE